MSTAIALLIALIVMVTLYELTPVSTNLRAHQISRIRGESTETEQPSFLRILLSPFTPLGKILPEHWRAQVRYMLYWANFSGSWLGWSEVEFWGLSIAAAIMGFVLVLPSGLLMALVAGGIGLALPYALLRRSTRQSERALTRELPDALYLLAAQVAAGVVLPQALRRLSEYRGELARWIAYVSARSHGADIVTILHQEAALSGNPRLIGLATKIDLIAQKGAAGSADLLRALADDQSREYRRDVMQRVRELGSETIMFVIPFFFLPYVLVVGAPLFVSILQLLTRR